MTDIENLYNEFVKIPLPDNLREKQIQSINLGSLGSDAAGLVEKFILYRGQLSVADLKKLRQCFADLKTVTRELQGQMRLYFSTLHNLVHLTIDQLNNTKNLIGDKEKEKLILNWKEYYTKIRDILNEWDILGVRDMVLDEYDSINFLAYSALVSGGGLEDIKIAISKYLNESLDINVPDKDLTDLAIKIKKLKE